MDSDCNKEGIKQVPDYESDAECCTDNEVSVPVARKKPKLCLDWKLVQKFDNSEQAKTSLNAEGTWSQHYCHQTEEGKKYTIGAISCNVVVHNAPQKCICYSKAPQIQC